MKVEIVQAESISELDGLINNCIEERIVFDIKIISHVLQNNSICYTAMMMLGN